MGNIYVLVEHQRGKILDVTNEMITIGQKIASELGFNLGAILLGNNINDIKSSLRGVNNILYLDDPHLIEVIPEAYSMVLMDIINKKDPDLILMSDSNISNGLGSILSSKTKLPFINHCKDLKLENKQILVNSILFGGKIQVKTKPICNKAIIGIISGEFPSDFNQTLEISKTEELTKPDFTQLKSKFIKYVEPEAEGIDITKENVLIGIGRGIQKKENIPVAEEISKLLNGQICASRPIIDQGWLPMTRQVGRSGNTVSPKLYFSIGISGAPEHVVGMKNSKLIMSINSDCNAPIFNFSHYGIIGDAQKILPKLSEEIKKRKGVK